MMGQSLQMTTTPVETQILAVTVYPTQARITRQGQVQLSKGDITLELTDLPATLQPQSVTAQAHSPATLQAVQVIPIPALDRQAAAIQAAADAVRGLEDQFRHVKDHLAALGVKRTFLETLAERSSRTFSLGLAQKQMELSGVTDLLTYLEAEYTVLAEAIAQQERHKQDLDQQLQAARQTHQALQADLPDIHYRVCIPLYMTAAGTLTIEVTYQVDQVQWQPGYDVRFGETPDRLKLDYFANVYQQTGEDWQNVPLEFSTATPANSPTPPQLEAWHIDVPRLPNSPATKVSGRSRSPILNDTYRMLGAVPGSELPPNLDALESNSQTFSPVAMVRFQSLQTATLLSGSPTHRVSVAHCEFSTQFTYVALPQRCDAAYLQAHLTHAADGLPLLPGTAHLFRDGGYIGPARFDYVAPGQSFQLSLGMDDRFLVQRALVKRHISDSPDCQASLAYRLSIRNPLPHPVQVTLLEQIPVSRSDQVDIRLEPSAPSPTLPQAGLCQWDLTLNSETVAQIEYQYQVEYPCGITIAGLDI
jgi:uncharacterized protein (TIGR02231 family)